MLVYLLFTFSGSSNDILIKSFPNMLTSGLALSSVCKLHVSRWSACRDSWESRNVIIGEKVVVKISGNICFFIWERASERKVS